MNTFGRVVLFLFGVGLLVSACLMPIVDLYLRHHGPYWLGTHVQHFLYSEIKYGELTTSCIFFFFLLLAGGIISTLNACFYKDKSE